MSLSTEEDTCVRVLLNYSASRGVGGGGKTSPNVEGGFLPRKSFLPRFWKAVADGDVHPGNTLHPITNHLSIS